MAFGTFQSVTPEDQCVRKALRVQDTDLLDPTDADALEQGEWIEPTVADDREYERHGAAAEGPPLSYPTAAPKGSTDQQALGKAEAYVKWEEALTTTYDPGAAYPAGTYLKVNEVAIAGHGDRSVLTPVDAAPGQWAQAVVVRAPESAVDFTPMRIRRVCFIGDFS